MGHLNGILAQVGGNFNNNFRQEPKVKDPGGCPGGGGGGRRVLKLRFDRYIMRERSIG